MHIKKYYNLGKKILFPICRSITGKGIKKSLKIIKKEFPKLKIYHINSGKKVLMHISIQQDKEAIDILLQLKHLIEHSEVHSA